MKMRLILTCACFVLCLGFAAVNLQAQDESAPATKPYKMKNVNAQDFRGYQQIYSWLPTDRSNSVVFARDSYESATEDTELLASFKLSRSGRTGQTHKLMVLEGGSVGSAAAVLDASPSPPSMGAGFVFVAYRPPKIGNVARFAVARFDRDGLLHGNFDDFFEVKLSGGGLYYSNMWLTAAQRDGAIGIVMGVEIREYSSKFNGVRGSELYLAEFSEHGNLLSKPITSIKLPTVGDVGSLRPYTPAWNGQSWLVPAVMTVLKNMTYQGHGYTDEIGFRLMMVQATPKSLGGPFKTKVRKIAVDNTKIHWPTFQSPVFLPYVAWADKARPGEAKTLRLLYIKAAPAGSKGRGINAKLYSYFIQPINAKGRKIGKAISVRLANWNRLYANTPGLSGEETYCYFSNAWLRSDKHITIAHSRSAVFYRSADSSNRTELQLNYYSIDPVGGKMTTLAQSNYQNQLAFFGPVISTFGTIPGSLCVSRQEIGGKQKSNFFFSRLPN